MFARVQIFLGAQDLEDQRYVSQLLGDRKGVTADNFFSTGATLFDQKCWFPRRTEPAVGEPFGLDQRGASN
ncbi:hypothetical protein [Shinella sedimenti]|uniref:Uncharacterized protein n=1 Tax=Shinella sedimenti TaxID=2919913 RepID=A0ABT0CR66_9HYPH|nr:hypothetical protein [Shinella sedimenti]MCJ8151078.1 hypothetical protein [Shinella sedimenti]